MEETNHYDEYEIDLVKYIMLLWNNKIFIISLVILAILIAFAYSTFMIDPVYQAKSTLLILTPKYTTSLEVESFSINTYKNLATTDSIKQKVIDDLDLRNEDGERYSVNQLDNMMEINILASEENNNGDAPLGDAPLIEMKVTSKEPELAARIANTWADNFMSDSKEIRQNEVREVATVIQEQFVDTEEKLNDLKSDLLAFNKENRLGLLRQRLDNKENKLDTANKNVVDLESELGLKKSQLKNINERISEMEDNNIWSGELSNKDTSNTQFLEFKNNYLAKENELLNFKEKNNIYLLEKEINIEKDILSDYTNRKKELELMLEKKNDDKIIKIKDSLAQKEAELIFLRSEINNLEEDGYYLGDLEFKTFDKNDLDYKNNYLEVQNELLKFQKNNNVDILKSELINKQSVAKDYRDKINRMEDELKASNVENEEITTLLKGENNYWNLTKNLNETPLWNNLLNTEDIQVLSKIELNNQIINPVYKEFKLQSSRNDIILGTYPEQIKFYKNKLDIVESDIKNLNAQINILNNEKNNLVEDLNTYKDIYINKKNEYTNLKKELSKREAEVNSLEAEIDYFNEYELDNINKLISKYDNLMIKQENKIRDLETKLSSWRNEINYLESDIQNYKDMYNQFTTEYKNLVSNRLRIKLDIEEIKSDLAYYESNENRLREKVEGMQNQLWEGENKKSLLEQKIDDVQNTYNSLASRVEEARLTEAQRTSDVKFYAEAITPSRPLANNKMLNMAIAAVLAIMLGVFIVFFKEFIKDADLNKYE